MFIATSSIALILLIIAFMLISAVVVPVIALAITQMYTRLRDWNSVSMMRAEALKQEKLVTAKLEEQLLNEQIKTFLAEPWRTLPHDHE